MSIVYKPTRLRVVLGAGLVAVATVTALLLLPDRRAGHLAISSDPATTNSAPAVGPATQESQTDLAIAADNHEETSVDSIDAKSFACRTRAIDYSILLDNKGLPEHLIQMLACGQRAAAIDPLASLARAGDLDAFSVLGYQSWLCDRRSIDPIAVRLDEVLLGLKDRSPPPQVVERLRELSAQLLDDANSPEAVAVCDRLRMEAPALWGDYRASLDKAFGRPLDPAIDGPNIPLSFLRKRATDGSARDQLRLAQSLLINGRLENQTEAVHWLEVAAGALPEAKAQLAACMIQGCPTPSEDMAAAHDLLISAAKEGNRLAISALAGTGAAVVRGLHVDIPVPERYAWRHFYDRLSDSGCFGSRAYIAWATANEKRIDLNELTDAQKGAALRAASDLVASHVALDRQRMGCQ